MSNRWEQMDDARRARVIRIYRAFFVYGLTLAIVVGIPLSIFGLLLALVVGFWWVLFVGAGAFVCGMLSWLVGSIGTFGIAQTTAEIAAKRFLDDETER